VDVINHVDILPEVLVVLKYFVESQQGVYLVLLLQQVFLVWLYVRLELLLRFTDGYESA
jgi:hypothetical protein